MTFPPFWKNVSTVLGGTAMAQIVPIATLTVLTRIVPAADLGIYFVWFGAVNVLTVLATARLDMAIFVASREKDVFRILQTVIFISFAVCAIALLSKYVYESVFGKPLLTGGADQFAFAWAVTASVMAINQTVLAIFVYQARFKQLAKAKVLMAIAVSFTQLVICLAWPMTSSLVYVHLLASLLVTGFLLHRLVTGLGQEIVWLSWSKAKDLLKRNYRFPVFSMPSDFVSTFSAQLPLFVIAARFGGASAAIYALTIRVLAGPIGLLANSILAVFKEQAGRDFRELGNCLHSYRKAFLSLVVIAVPPFSLLYFLGEEAFVIFFGADWAGAGRIAETLSPMFFMKFVASPLSYTMYLADRQVHDLVWQVFLFGMTFVIFEISSNLETAVFTYSIGYSALYLVYLGMSYAAAHGVRA